MNIVTRKKELVKEFSPMFEKSSSLSKIWIGTLMLIILAGFYAFIVQFTQGQEVTGMRDNVVWGIFTVNFIFFVGLSYSGAFIAGVLHFSQTPLKNAILRIVEIMTVISLILGPIFIILCMARLDRLHYLFMYPRIQSPITWDIIAITSDLFGCFIYLYLTFIPDLAILRDATANEKTCWRKKTYKYLALGYHDTPSQSKRLHKITKIMSTMIIAMAIVAYTVLAWIFSLTVQPGWNSSIFAPYFIISGLYSGVATIIIAMFVIRKYYKLERYITKIHFTVGGIILLIFSLLYGYFTFSEYFSRWFSHKRHDVDLLNTLFDRYYWEFFIANYIGIILPIFILFFKKLRTIKFITLSSAIVLVGFWLNRYLIVVPTLETPYLPIQDTRAEFVRYSATWVEWSLTFAGFAAFCLFFTLILKFVPAIPMSGILENEEIKNGKKKKVKPIIVTEF